MSTIDELERRVAALEQEVEGEKIVSRYILDQTRRNGDDLAALRKRVDRLEEKIDALARDQAKLRTDFQALRTEFQALRAEFQSLRRDLPAIIGEVMREVLREERR